MSRPPTAWAALLGNPWRLLASTWPLRSVAYLLGGAAVGALTLIAFFVMLSIGVATLLVVVGIVVIGSLPLIPVSVGALERRRVRLMLGPDEPAVIGPHPPAPPGLRGWFRTRRRQPLVPREAGYAVLLATVLWFIDLLVVNTVLVALISCLFAPLIASYDTISIIFWTADTAREALPIAVIGTPVAYVIGSYLLTFVAAAQASLARLLLGAREHELEQRIGELRRSRLELVDAFETERKRIERHLHDGVQQRLVALTMTLGRAEMDVAEGPGLDLVRQAHREAEAALADLREAVRGIHPRVLIDHGIAAAVREVADRMPMPVAVEIELPGRLPEPLEAAAYFTVSEALTNVARHSQASNARVVGWVQDGRLVLDVTDSGVGGARIGAGSGLAGLVTRLDALGGTLTVTSPDGGPTSVRMECPCEW